VSDFFKQPILNSPELRSQSATSNKQNRDVRGTFLATCCPQATGTEPYPHRSGHLRGHVRIAGSSRSFSQPKSGCIAVKVINHPDDEVMKVFRVQEVVE
jgi:hypothetical protein